jgi:hypothetical protein
MSSPRPEFDNHPSPQKKKVGNKKGFSLAIDTELINEDAEQRELRN